MYRSITWNLLDSDHVLLQNNFNHLEIHVRMRYICWCCYISLQAYFPSSLIVYHFAKFWFNTQIWTTKQFYNKLSPFLLLFLKTNWSWLTLEGPLGQRIHRWWFHAQPPGCQGWPGDPQWQSGFYRPRTGCPLLLPSHHLWILRDRVCGQLWTKKLHQLFIMSFFQSM